MFAAGIKKYQTLLIQEEMAVAWVPHIETVELKSSGIDFFKI